MLNDEIHTAQTDCNADKSSKSSSNQFFDWQRFRCYIKAHTNENKRSYFWFFAIISMMYFMILMMVLLANTYDTLFQMVIYYAGLLTTGSVFAVRYFSSLSRSGSALTMLMQPVSVFEKWLLATLTIVIIYPMIYTMIFEVMTLPMTWFSRQYILARDYKDASDLLNVQLFIPLTTINLKNDPIEVLAQIPVWFVYLGITAYAVTGSIFFKRLPLIKSIALGFVLFLMLIFVAMITDMGNNAITLFYLFDSSREYHINTMSLVANFLFWIVAPLLMWVASFFALKERDL